MQVGEEFEMPVGRCESTVSGGGSEYVHRPASLPACQPIEVKCKIISCYTFFTWTISAEMMLVGQAGLMLNFVMLWTVNEVNVFFFLKRRINIYFKLVTNDL